jgi:hypothetical protein
MNKHFTYQTKGIPQLQNAPINETDGIRIYDRPMLAKLDLPTIGLDHIIKFKLLYYKGSNISRRNLEWLLNIDSSISAGLIH